MTQITQMTHPKKHHKSQVACHVKIRKKDTISPYVSTRPDVDQDTARSRTFFIRTYLKPEAFTQLFPSCIAWAYILHDKDDKAPHYHILMAYKNQHFLSAEAKEFHQLAERHLVDGQPQSTFIEIAHKKAFCFAYLTHSDPQSLKAEKHRYSDSEVLGENLSFFADDVHSQSGHNVVDILDDIIEGVSYREMARKYGSFFVTNFGRFKQYSELVTIEETSHQHDPVALAFREYLAGEREAFSLISTIIEHEAYKLTFDKKMTDIEKGYKDKQNRSQISLIEGIYSEKLAEWRSVRNDQEAMTDIIKLQGQHEKKEPLARHLCRAEKDCILLGAVPSLEPDQANKLFEEVKARA